MNHDKIYIHGLRVDTIIGIFDWERQSTQPIVLDLEMSTDIQPAANSDAITDALDYSAITQRITTLLRYADYQLIETLAEKVAQIVITEFNLTELTLRVSKPSAIQQTDDVGLVITRTSKHYE